MRNQATQNKIRAIVIQRGIWLVMTKKIAEKKELNVEGEWASLKGNRGIGGRHVGVKLSFKKSNPEIRNISVSASDLIGIYKQSISE